MGRSIARGCGRTVLLVGQRPETDRCVRRILAGDTNVKILTAANGGRALKILARDCVDLIVLDVNLPDIGGTEVLRRIRGVEPWVPVLVVTTRGSPVTVRAAMELGALDYLTVPVDRGEVEGVMRAALDAAPARAPGVIPGNCSPAAARGTVEKPR